MNPCPNCGDGDTTEAMETSTLDYGVGESVQVVVTQPVIRCKACGEAFTDFRGEEARDAAVAKYLRVMGKPAIKALRSCVDALVDAATFGGPEKYWEEGGVGYEAVRQGQTVLDKLS